MIGEGRQGKARTAGTVLSVDRACRRTCVGPPVTTCKQTGVWLSGRRRSGSVRPVSGGQIVDGCGCCRRRRRAYAALSYVSS